MNQRPTRRSVLTGGAALVVAAFTGAARAHNGINHNPVIHDVEIRDFAFSPQAIEVRHGDTIRWTNRDVAPHTATARDESWDTGTLRRNESIELVVTAAMDGDYFCRFHPMMAGSIKASAP